MSNITDYILSKTSKITTVPEVTASSQPFEMFNTGGVEVEVGELLYSLVRVWKPEYIVETGTHLGISALYMGLACERNKFGHVDTYEVISSLQRQAQQLWTDFEMAGRIKSHLVSSLSAMVPHSIDLLFLDSEPQLRFDEFRKFWPQVREGGLIIIHDLHATLGKHGKVHHGTLDWPYGEWEPKLGKFVKNHEVQLVHVPNPRGTVIFQKTQETDENIRCLREQ